MVFTFLKARGLDVGSSLVEDDKLDLVSRNRRSDKHNTDDIINEYVCIYPYGSFGTTCIKAVTINHNTDDIINEHVYTLLQSDRIIDRTG